ncbi:hypothetical protein RUM44_006155 [Polyplax serrata]|uniref:Uncharacterized protein n=1 Tax=Polyplax serrata TaxID=468196 RepID=A0ABR1AZ49_POLSC
MVRHLHKKFWDAPVLRSRMGAMEADLYTAWLHLESKATAHTGLTEVFGTPVQSGTLYSPSYSAHHMGPFHEETVPLTVTSQISRRNWARTWPDPPILCNHKVSKNVCEKVFSRYSRQRSKTSSHHLRI